MRAGVEPGHAVLWRWSSLHLLGSTHEVVQLVVHLGADHTSLVGKPDLLPDVLDVVGHRRVVDVVVRGRRLHQVVVERVVQRVVEHLDGERSHRSRRRARLLEADDDLRLRLVRHRRVHVHVVGRAGTVETSAKDGDRVGGRRVLPELHRDRHVQVARGQRLESAALRRREVQVVALQVGGPGDPRLVVPVVDQHQPVASHQPVRSRDRLGEVVTVGGGRERTGTVETLQQRGVRDPSGQRAGQRGAVRVHHRLRLKQYALDRNGVLIGPGEPVQVPAHGSVGDRSIPRRLRDTHDQLVRRFRLVARVRVPRRPPALRAHQGGHGCRGLTDLVVEGVEVAEVVDVLRVVRGDQRGGGLRLVPGDRHLGGCGDPRALRHHRLQPVARVEVRTADSLERLSPLRGSHPEQAERLPAVGQCEDLVVDLHVADVGAARAQPGVQVREAIEALGHLRFGLIGHVQSQRLVVDGTAEHDVAADPHAEQDRLRPGAGVEVLELPDDPTRSRGCERCPHPRSDAQRVVRCDRAVVHLPQRGRIRGARRERRAPAGELPQVRPRERLIYGDRSRSLSGHQRYLSSECGWKWWNCGTVLPLIDPSMGTKKSFMYGVSV